MTKINIAIDGPAGAGKSTVAKRVAEQLHYIYVDTGAMYRAITWKSLQENIDAKDKDRLAQMTADSSIELTLARETQQVLVDGQDVTEEIRTASVNRRVSHIAKIENVRKLLVEKQQKIAKNKGVVMDGRDIGTAVLPAAELKIFLTASARVRAERRFQELSNGGDSALTTVQEMEQEITARDQMDEQREVSPLRKAEDAIFLDSSDMTIDEVVNEILQICRTYFS